MPRKNFLTSPTQACSPNAKVPTEHGLQHLDLQQAIHLLYGVDVLASGFITAIDKVYEPRFPLQENPSPRIPANSASHR
ncbi:hypothetical protein NicSoilB11_42710 (plasmid) [Arthrobacter sp. NicSoilB11]|jgi:hypothetical protein|nr:hypothetical protein NicSoilB11_42710 [Arthrobacter sp. NicSoilB11]GIU57985.1 hypothetical protein NicSoilC12_37340 [Arthrobacter sp. NicSoilC12]VXB96439.1 hypothetical protein ARTHRO8AJ_40157 [Arthrobacter sp. 8AJ]